MVTATAGAERKSAGARDSFWGTAGGAAKKAKAGDGGADVHKEATRPKDTTPVASGDLLAAKTESQPVTPKHVEPPRHQEEKIEGKEADEDVFEDDLDDDVEPEAQPVFPRSEVSKDVSNFRQNAVHVYGLDFLKTGHMDEIFSQFNHKFVEWINDSSANIIFADAASAKKALESLSFAKAGDEPWRRTPDILVSEDVPPIFLQMRLAAATDVKPSKRSVPSPAAPMQPRPQRRDQMSSTSRRMRSDNPDTERQAQSSAKRPRKAEISEEELQKRRKRAERFGASQPAIGRPAEKPQAASKPEASPTVAAASGTTSNQGVPEGDGGSDMGKQDPAPGEAVAPAEQAVSSEAKP